MSGTTARAWLLYAGKPGERMKIRLGVFFHAEPVRETPGTRAGGSGEPPASDSSNR